ncbi:hypothetical protein AR688_09860 [Rheinheimera sp. EpRS3]|nr:hypothetical protein AR688_09860 [Rheinheimera sp. EpRS3]
MVGIVVLLGISFVVLTFEQARYKDAVQNREQSIRLAAELRQSSNDLARLVRTYIITGNPLYKAQFQAVVEIRDGIRPRPKNYTLAYWDIHATDTGLSAPADEELTEAVSLIELMRRTGITDAELENLRRSKEKSDILVAVENQAIELVEEDTPTNPVKRDKALNMLADDYFLKMKAKIMAPIVETEQMIITRTQSAVNASNQRLILVIICLFVLGGLLVWLIFKVGQQLRLIIGGSVRELQRTLNELGKGDFLTPIRVADAGDDSVLGWLAKTQRKLAQLNLAHFKAIVDSSDDAIISKNIHGIIASWNRGAEKVFGYTAAEMVGKPMTLIIPPERLHEEPELLSKIAAGEKVDHFQTQRQHKNGELVDVSVTISPIYNNSGEVIGASKIARNISAAIAAEAEIKRLAFFDTLTGLANRRLLHDRLNQLYVSALRENTSFAVLFLDLDNFKTLNDTKGHEAGDELLQQAAKRLLHCVRESDTVARYGGDEFVVLINGLGRRTASSEAGLEQITTKISKELSQPYYVAGGYHVCTTSIGASIFNRDVDTAAGLIQQADHAMYLAKTSGKNGFRIYQHL